MRPLIEKYFRIWRDDFLKFSVRSYIFIIEIKTSGVSFYKTISEFFNYNWYWL